MRSLRSHDWKGVYRTGDDDLLQDFYLKALSCSTKYDRAVGYFSSQLITFASQGISELIRSGGKMRLIIGHPLEDDEYGAVKDGASLSWAYDQLERIIVETLDGVSGDVAKHRLQLLSWMLACGALEIKFAFRKQGMYHEKVGIIYDSEDNCLVFQGSANETFSAMHVESNAESISVFPSWKEAIFAEYGRHFVVGFEALWNGRQRHTYTVEVPSSVYESIARKVAAEVAPDLDLERRLAEHERILSELEQSHFENAPFIPEFIDGHEFSIREHQRDALTKWRANDYRGIMKLATGSGKTITAIYGAVKIYEAFRRLAVIIAVPYVELANQWVSNLAQFGIYPHKCFDSRNSWYDRFKLDIQAFNASSKDFLCAVTVNRTLSSSADFADLLASLNPGDVFFIGDECHRHGAKSCYESLPNADLRLGLSATPFRSDEDEIDSPFPDEARERILEYYGPIVAEYTLSDAINDQVLTPYYYHVHGVRLTEYEQERYEELTTKIGHLISMGERPSDDRGTSSLTTLCGERSRLLGGAENKNFVLTELLGGLEENVKGHALFYCAEGSSDGAGGAKKHTDRVSEILNQAGWRSSHFTSEETNAERRSILDSFVGEGIDALVSMKVLDEGIDLPVCRTAFILASTKNPRQYVQRRGRILRRFPGKKYATIHDFVVLPAAGWSDTSASRGLVKAEMERVFDFMELANNKMDVYKELEEMGVEI